MNGPAPIARNNGRLPRIAFPLTARILLWFFLNLLFLAAALFLLVRWQFQLGLDSLLAGQASRRVQAMAEVVAADLGSRPRSEWDAVIRRSAAAYRVELGLYGHDGRLLAGDLRELPPAVTNRLRPPGPPQGLPPKALPGVGGPRPPGPPPEGMGLRPPREWPPGPEGRPVPPPHAPEPARGRMEAGPFGTATLRAGDPARYWVLVRIPLPDLARPGMPLPTLVMASDSPRAGGLLFDFTPWLVVGAGALVLSVLFWWPLVHGITRSLREMTAAAEQIARSRFDVDLKLSRTDELGQLARALDQMAARLKEAFTGQKRFLGDTAHELCSPLARMEMALGILEQRSDPDHQACLTDVREEVRAMSSLVNDLLAFSKASVGAPAVSLRPLALAPLVAEMLRREGPDGENLEVKIESDIEVIASPELLTRALGNTVRNAIRYAGDAGPITISAARQAGEVLVRVTDCGPGVPESALHRLFDPFFRPESARTRETGGTGLGLAIVKSCVEACGGSVSVSNRVPRGFCVELRLKA